MTPPRHAGTVDRRPETEARARERRLDELRTEAAREGSVSGRGVDVEGGPMPPPRPGYGGQPVLKPPVWTWEVPLYFFTGGLGGMAAVLALMAWATGEASGVVTAALWVAAIAGGIVSPVLLTLDLGRPKRFLNMLRVFKHRSPMSVGAWVLAAFGGCVVPALGCAEWYGSTGGDLAAVSTWLFLIPSGLLGAVLATYTGVLIGATAVPAWLTHRGLLPVHFGVAGLGSAAAALELLGHTLAPLHVIGFTAAIAETVVGAAVELRRHGRADHALRSGPAPAMLRGAGALSGPVSLVLRAVGLRPWAAAAFLLGALLSRYGWLQAGRRSALDPAAVFALERDGR